MSEATHYPNFYEPTEGRTPVGSEQLAETTQAFNGLFDDLMLQGMDKVERFEPIEGRPTANLLRLIEVDGQTYSLALEDKSLKDSDSDAHGTTFRDSERTTRQISLQRIYESYGREYWSYMLGADGTVRRWDSGDVAAKMRKDLELGVGSISNSRLEEDMGLNNQPVTPDEIRGLQDFLARATDLPRYR